MRALWRTSEPDKTVAARSRPVSAPAAEPVRGTLAVKTVRPGSLATVTVPPCAWRMPRTIDSPSPVLPARRDRDESPRTNRSKSVGVSFGGMPGPSSATVTSAASAVAVSCTSTCVPAGVCTRAFVSRLAKT